MKRILLGLVLLFALSPLTPVQAGDGVLYIAADRPEGYDRSLFKHWIDADKNGCDTRKEVLIAEAIVKPKISKKCVLTGGKWLSSFDGKSHTKDSGLDVDHLVPLAEAWRSGAWAWTDKEREKYANFLENDMALNAVTASLNRSKGDKDIANWLPKKNVCQYLEGWVSIKAYFKLTVDIDEAKTISRNITNCGLSYGAKYPPAPVEPTPTPIPSATIIPASKLGVIPNITRDSKLNLLVTGFTATMGSDYALVYCSILVYEWGLADHLGGVYYKQGEQDFEVPVDLTNLKSLPTSFHLKNCKENEDVSFKITWTSANSTYVPVFEKMAKPMDLSIVKSYVPIAIGIPDLQGVQGYINNYDKISQSYVLLKGSITGESTLHYYASYPKDICKTTGIDSKGNSLVFYDEYFDRFNSFGTAIYRSDTKELIEFNITCIKSGISSIEVEHIGGRLLEIKPTQTPNPPLVTQTGITPGAFCTPAGALGKNSSGVIYTCKTVYPDNRNRWRQ